MSNSVSYLLHRDTWDEAVAALEKLTDVELRCLALNTWLNDWIADHADEPVANESELIGRLLNFGPGQRIPYAGWGWRATDFANNRVTVANCGPYVGVCENNKWGYDTRYLTPDETTELINLVVAAMNAEHEDQDEAIKAIYDWFQLLSIPVAPWNR